MGGLTTGLVWLSILDGLEVSLLSAFVHCQRGSFFWLHICGGFLIRSIQACSFLVVSTHQAEWLSTAVKVVSFDYMPEVLAGKGQDGL